MDTWENNSVQFPRLLAEICATQEQLNIPALAEAMDLSIDQVNELFDRAQQEWERIKSVKTSARDEIQSRIFPSR